MPKPSKFRKGKKLSDQQYKYELEKYYEKEKIYKSQAYKKFRAKCTNKNLFDAIKKEAKAKFKVYPSSYASAWVKREYKKRGGKLKDDNRQTNIKVNDEGKITEITQTIGIEGSPTVTLPSGQTVSMDGELKVRKEFMEEGELFFNTSDATFAFNEKHIKKDKPDERKIVERRGDAKEGDLWIHPNTGNLKMKVGDKWVTVNDPSKLPKINKQKAKKELSSAFAERRKKEETKVKVVVLETKPKITRGQFLYKYKSPQNFYSWQDLAREHINCKHRSKQYIFDSPAYYLKDDLCNSLINTNIDNLKLNENPNIVNPSFFLLNSNKINNVKYSFVECHNWGKNEPSEKYLREEQKLHFKFDVYVNFVIETGKVHYYAFNWNNLNIYKFIKLPIDDEIVKDHFRTVVNLILLMNQQPDIITEEYIPSKIVTLQKKYKVQSEIKPRAICWVGKDFTTRVVKLKPKQDEDMLVVAGNKRKLRPHWRRGHWHTVLKGAKRKERKMRWYQPVFVLGNAA